MKSVHVDLKKDQVVVESSLTSSQVQSLIEKTGKSAVLQGYGGFNGNKSHLLESSNRVVLRPRGKEFPHLK